MYDRSIHLLFLMTPEVLGISHKSKHQKRKLDSRKTKDREDGGI